jgi:hypothetical protein
VSKVLIDVGQIDEHGCVPVTIGRTTYKVKAALSLEQKDAAAKELFKHAKKRRSNKPEDLEPRTDLQKRMQSGSF